MAATQRPRLQITNALGQFFIFGLLLLGSSENGFALAVGDVVQANTNIRVRTAPPSLTDIGGQSSGATGTVTSGPLYGTANGYTGNWWQVDWSSGTDGWSAEPYLTKLTTYTMTIASSNPSSGVYIYVGPNDNQGLADGTTSFTRQFVSGTSVTLIAPTSAGGNNFSKWTRNGSDYDSSRTTTVTMSASYTMTAVFVAAPPITHTVTVNSTNPNSGVNIASSTLDNNTQAGGVTSFTRTFNHNATATYVAPATVGSSAFQKWQRDGVDLTTSTTASITMDANRTLTAVYVSQPLPTITSVSPNPVTGSNVAQPFTINGSNFNANSKVNLRNLTTGTSYQDRTVSSRSSAQLVINPVFGTPAHTWSVEVVNGTDSSGQFQFQVGSLTSVVLSINSSNPSSGVYIYVGPNDSQGLADGTTSFTRQFVSGTSVTLIAPTTASGNNFSKWTLNGTDYSSSRTITFTISANSAMTAVFTAAPPVTHTVTVNSTNPNSGVNIVSSTLDNNTLAGGVTSFTRTFNHNATATYVAPATVGSSAFQKWQRDGVDLTTSTTASITMDANRTLTAVYVSQPLPTITSVSPNPVTGSNVAQPFTINGSNFNANSKVNLRNLTTSTSYLDRAFNFLSSKQLVVNPVFGTPAHTWSVEVVNGTDSSGQFQFQVGSPSVAVLVFEPGVGASWTAGDTRTLKWSVTGSATNQIAYFVPEVALSGTNYTALASVNGSSSRSTTWTIPSGANTIDARVRVTAYNAANASMNTGTSGTFSITPPAIKKPKARIVANWDAVSGTATLFKGDQSTASDNTASITGYQWSFGDGGTSTSSNPTHTFTVSAGSKQFTVTLKVTDSLGNTDSTTGLVTVGARTQGTNVQQSLSPDPVNLATGNYTYEHTDMQLPGIGMPFEFKRFYNSKDSRFVGPPLGFGWTHSYNEHVTDNADGSVTVLRGDGNVESFTKGTGGIFVAEPGIHDSLTKTKSGLYVLTSKEQSSREFDANGRLAFIRDPNNNTVQIVYSVSGTIEKFVDTAGRNIAVTSDGMGRITALTDPLGRIVSFAYDASGNLISSTDRRSRVTQFTYDANHQILTARDPRGNVFVTNVYDDLKRIVTAQRDALSGETTFEYDFVTRITTMTDALGNKSYHHHDDHLRVISVTDVRGKTEAFEYDADNNRTRVTDKRGAVTTYTYDKKGNVLSKIDALGKKTTISYDTLNRPLARVDAAGAVTRFAYDTRSNLVSTTNPLGYITRASYDARGLATRLTDPLLHVTQQEFDVAGNLVRVTDALLNETRYEYDVVGRRTAMIDAKTARTSYEYDAEDHPTKTIDPLLRSISAIFDANGNRTETTDQRGNRTQFTYDIKDRLTQVEDALGNKTSHTYDAMDRKTSTTDARGNTTQFEYDAAGNLIETKDARNNETWITYDANGNSVNVTNALGQISWNEYDALNRVARTGDPLGNVTRTEYDAVGRKVRSIDALGRSTVFKYDLAGRLLSVTDPAGGSVRFSYDKIGNRLTQTDQRGNTTRYTFDALNRVILMQEAMGAKTSYVYDAVGNRVKKTDPNNQVTEFFYGLNRSLDRVLYADGKEVAFTYDAAQNRTGMTDSLGNSSWQYDALNRVTTHTDPFGLQLGYGYDVAGNRTSLVYPGNKTVTYAYDELGRMTQVKDWAGRASSYSYDPMGRLVSATNPNGTDAALKYDNAGRVIELAHNGPASTVIAHYSIALDPVGNHREVQQEEPLQAMPPVEDTVYSYDKDNRLVKAGAVTFGYDTSGNTTRRASDTFGYDASDHLANASVGGVSRSFGYDGLGNRLVRTVGSGTTRFVLDLNSGLSRILCETDTSGTPIAYYIYGMNLVSRIAADGSVRYYHGDVRGSTIALTDGTGATTDKYAYDEFGSVLAKEGTTENPFRYLGRSGVYDEGNDMLYVRARYYTPSLGRFFSKDIFPSEDGNGQSLHRYIYALNNPVARVDPSGYLSWESLGTFGTGVLQLAAGYGGIALEVVKAGVDVALKPTPLTVATAAIGSLAGIDESSRNVPAGFQSIVNSFTGKGSANADDYKGIMQPLIGNRPAQFILKLNDAISLADSIGSLRNGETLNYIDEAVHNTTLRGAITNPLLLSKLHSLVTLPKSAYDIGKYALQIPEILETNNVMPGQFEK